MQDTGLTVTVKAVGIPEAQAKLEALNATMTKITVNQNGSVTATGKQASAFNGLAGATDKASRSQANFFAHIAKTTIQSALVNKLFLEFVDVAGQAAKQVDLMNNFPATMASLGQSAESSNKAFKTLTDYVGQIGGNLGDATSAVTRFTGVTGDVKAAVAIYQGLNNALIAGDSSLEEQRQAAVQFAQAFERGKPDMREWLNLTQNMSNQLAIVAKEMGFVNANALGESLRAGETSMADFTTKLTELSTGTGPIAQQALARMNGMQFAFNVMKNTMVQGLAQIINTLNRQNIVSFFTFLTQVIQVLTGWVLNLITLIVSLINLLGSLFGLPAIKLQKGTEGVADNLQTGADGAGDLADGLGDGAKAAKEINKSLASFDKMNVLADKTSGKDKNSGSGGTNFDAGQLGDLGDIFAGISPKLAEVSKWAKAFAGLLAGIAGIKIAQGIIDQLDGVGKSFKKAMTGVEKFKESLQKFPTKALDKVKEAPVIIGGKFDALKGVAAGLGKFLINPWVLAVVAIAALVGALIWLYNENETFKKGFDKVWNPIIDTLMLAYKVITDYVGYAIGWMIGEWKKLEPVLQPVIDIFNSFIGWVKELMVSIGLTGSSLEIFGKVIGVIGAFIVTLMVAPLLLLIAALALVGLGFVAVVGFIAWFIKAAGDKIAAFVWAVKTFFDDAKENIQKNWNSMITWWKELFTKAWEGIQEAWADVLQWFIDLRTDIENTWNGIVDWFRNLFLNAWNAIKFIWNEAGKYFQEKWNNIKSAFAEANSWFSLRFAEAWNSITSTFRDAGEWFRVNVVEKIIAAFNGIGGRISSFFAGVWDAVGKSLKDTINSILKLPLKIPSVEIAGKTIGGQTLIPRLAKGGIVDQATMAIVGESGSEAVIPLENNTEGLDRLAELIGNKMGGGNQPIQLVVQIGEDKIATKIIDLINDKTHMSGRNTIYV